MKPEILLILFIALQIADCVTTVKILSAGGTEVNPIMAKLFGLVGVVPGLIIMKGIIIVAMYIASLYQPWLLIPAVVLYVGIVGWNAYQMTKN